MWDTVRRHWRHRKPPLSCKAGLRHSHIEDSTASSTGNVSWQFDFVFNPHMKMPFRCTVISIPTRLCAIFFPSLLAIISLNHNNLCTFFPGSLPAWRIGVVDVGLRYSHDSEIQPGRTRRTPTTRSTSVSNCSARCISPVAAPYMVGSFPTTNLHERLSPDAPSVPSRSILSRAAPQRSI